MGCALPESALSFEEDMKAKSGNGGHMCKKRRLNHTTQTLFLVNCSLCQSKNTDRIRPCEKLHNKMMFRNFHTQPIFASIKPASEIKKTVPYKCMAVILKSSQVGLKCSLPSF